MRRFNSRRPLIHPSPSLYCIVTTLERRFHSLYPISLHHPNQPIHNTITSLPSPQSDITSRIHFIRFDSSRSIHNTISLPWCNDPYTRSNITQTLARPFHRPPSSSSPSSSYHSSPKSTTPHIPSPSPFCLCSLRKPVISGPFQHPGVIPYVKCRLLRFRWCLNEKLSGQLSRLGC
jgi:hypothetical protein